MARKILLADDSVTAQNMGRKILADAGYEVVTVNNGSAALKKIAEAKPDLIVLDVYMPGYSGLEVCQRLKESGDTSRIPILLTVGKLEPFKPEEAKRVHAEGFIVKPFEASELLSALAKLEDKMVPRADTFKPGRFARAIAAVEEGRYDNTVAIDEDSGWKNRISFPSKKKKAEKPVEPEDTDDPAIYNPINKDLRTVLDHNPPHPSGPPTRSEEHVDLGALAADGLPKDVTPEEIAALAAAAAQVKGVIEGHGSESPARPIPPAPEQPKAESTSLPPQAAAQDVPAAPVKVAATVAEQPQAVPEMQAPAEPVQEPPLEGATFAAQKPVEEPQTEAAQPATGAAKAEAAAETPAAVPVNEYGAAVVPAPEPAAPEPQPEPEPATMAVAAGVGASATSSRWTAVAVPLAPEEAGLVLQDEMRKMYAAFVGANGRPPVSVADASIPFTENASIPAAELPAAAESEPPVPPAPSEVAVGSLAAPAVPEPTAERAVPASEPIHAVVKEFETVAAPPTEAPPVPVVPEPHAEATETAPAAVSSAPEIAESPQEQAPEKPAEMVAPVSEPPVANPEPDFFAASHVEAQAVAQEVPASEAVAARPTEPPVTTPAAVEEIPVVAPEEPQVVEAVAVVETTPAAEATATIEPAPAAEPLPAPEPVAAVEASPEPTPMVAQAEPVEATASPEPIPGGIPDMAKKESEIAATTAAAWASWRRIRETGDTKTAAPTPAAEPAPPEQEEPAPPAKENEEAAMAVAAGAEKAPEEIPESSEEGPEIASIVDSVLADLRPKIVEEISRKLGKKKKK